MTRPSVGRMKNHAEYFGATVFTDNVAVTVVTEVHNQCLHTERSGGPVVSERYPLRISSSLRGSFHFTARCCPLTLLNHK
jgi:hypothetical protein